MAWDRLAKVFDLERPLQARGEEPPKGSNQGGKGCKDKDVELKWRKGEAVQEGHPRREVVSVREEDGVRRAFETSPDVGAEILSVQA